MNFFLEEQIKNLNLYNNLRTPTPHILITSLTSYPHILIQKLTKKALSP